MNDLQKKVDELQKKVNQLQIKEAEIGAHQYYLTATIHKLQVGIRNRDSFIEAVNKALLAIASNEIDRDVILKGIADMIHVYQELMDE